MQWTCVALVNHEGKESVNWKKIPLHSHRAISSHICKNMFTCIPYGIAHEHHMNCKFRFSSDGQCHAQTDRRIDQFSCMLRYEPPQLSEQTHYPQPPRIKIKLARILTHWLDHNMCLIISCTHWTFAYSLATPNTVRPHFMFFVCCLNLSNTHRVCYLIELHWITHNWRVRLCARTNVDQLHGLKDKPNQKLSRYDGVILFKDVSIHGAGPCLHKIALKKCEAFMDPSPVLPTSVLLHLTR